MERERAIEILRKEYDPRGCDETLRKALETLIPELKESEDERIRKELVQFLTEIKNISEGGCDSWHVRKEDAKMCTDFLAYLEKQKEQKPEDRFEEAREKYQVEWSEEDEKIVNNIVSVLGQYIDYKAVSGTGSGYATPRYSKEINFLKSLRPQPKQEWDTHDKAIVNCIVCCLDGQFVPEVARKQALEWFNKHRRDFLNNPSWKPSEQEKGALRTAIHILTDERSFPKAAAQLQNILNAFEGKESRKDWKPSEEQMEALLWCTAHLGGADHRVLAELYEHLKKLM